MFRRNLYLGLSVKGVMFFDFFSQNNLGHFDNYFLKIRDSWSCMVFVTDVSERSG